MRRQLINLFISFLICNLAHAARLAPKDINPVIYDNKLEISAPHLLTNSKGQRLYGRYLLVKNHKTKETKCWHKVYTVKYIAGLETDVQDNFIKSVSLKGDFVIVINEKQDQFKIPLSYLCK